MEVAPDRKQFTRSSPATTDLTKTTLDEAYLDVTKQEGTPSGTLLAQHIELDIMDRHQPAVGCLKLGSGMNKPEWTDGDHRMTPSNSFQHFLNGALFD